MGDVPDYSRQPPPLRVEDPVSAHDLVLADLQKVYGSTPGIDLLGSDLITRRQYGLNKYGVVLHVHNGRNHALDAYDEVVDLLVYSRMMMAEDPVLAEGDFYSDYLHLIAFAAKLRLLLSERVH